MSEDSVTITLSRAEMAARGRVGGLVTATRYNMSEIAKRARVGLAAKFLREAGGDPVQAERLRKLFYAKLTERSLAARSSKKKAAPAKVSAETADAEDHGNDFRAA